MYGYNSGFYCFRVSLVVVFYILFFYTIINHAYLSAFEIKSDYLQYYNFYYSEKHQLDRFGIEILTPILFSVSRFIGLSYYDFVFVFGLMWLIPIAYLSKKVSFLYLTLYFLYFIFYFVDSYAFLLRQYLAFYFFIPFAFLEGKKRWIFFILTIASHLSALVFLFLSWFRFKSRKIYLIISFLAIAIMLLNLSGFGFSRTLLWLVDVSLEFEPNLKRKFSLLSKLENNVEPGGWKMYFLLSFTIVLHSFFIAKDSAKFSFLRALFFSAIIALVFSDFKILSNRLGFLAYYFAIPYFALVASFFYMKSDFSIKFHRYRG